MDRDEMLDAYGDGWHGAHGKDLGVAGAVWLTTEMISLECYEPPTRVLRARRCINGCVSTTTL